MFTGRKGITPPLEGVFYEINLLGQEKNSAQVWTPLNSKAKRCKVIPAAANLFIEILR